MKRAAQLFIGLMTTISIFASPVIACACDHHEPAEKVEKSCHQQAVSTHHGVAANSHHSEEDNPLVNGFSNNDDCACVQPAPKAFAKSEGVKLKKQFTAISPLPDPEAISALVSLSYSDNFPGVDPLVLRPFLRSEPSRGPPAL